MQHDVLGFNFSKGLYKIFKVQNMLRFSIFKFFHSFKVIVTNIPHTTKNIWKVNGQKRIPLRIYLRYLMPMQIAFVFCFFCEIFFELKNHSLKWLFDYRCMPKEIVWGIFAMEIFVHDVCKLWSTEIFVYYEFWRLFGEIFFLFRSLFVFHAEGNNIEWFCVIEIIKVM